MVVVVVVVAGCCAGVYESVAMRGVRVAISAFCGRGGEEEEGGKKSSSSKGRALSVGSLLIWMLVSAE